MLWKTRIILLVHKSLSTAPSTPLESSVMHWRPHVLPSSVSAVLPRTSSPPGSSPQLQLVTSTHPAARPRRALTTSGLQVDNVLPWHACSYVRSGVFLCLARGKAIHPASQSPQIRFRVSLDQQRNNG